MEEGLAEKLAFAIDGLCHAHVHKDPRRAMEQRDRLIAAVRDLLDRSGVADV